jgi:hypothetical protein
MNAIVLPDIETLIVEPFELSIDKRIIVVRIAYEYVGVTSLIGGERFVSHQRPLPDDLVDLVEFSTRGSFLHRCT